MEEPPYQIAIAITPAAAASHLLMAVFSFDVEIHAVFLTFAILKHHYNNKTIIFTAFC